MTTGISSSITVFIFLLSFTGMTFARAQENVTDNGHVLGNQSHDIKVVLDHIFISKKNDSFEISEIVVFRNEGQEIYYSKDNHTFFAISIPPDARDLKTRAMECCLVQDEGVVYMDPMQTIGAGENFEMQVSYDLPEVPEFVFNKTAVYNTTSLLLFIDKRSGLGMEGSHEVMVISGNEYEVSGFNDLRAGDKISVPVRTLMDPGYLYAGIGLLFLILTGLIYRFRGKIFMRRKEEETLESLEIEKRKIFRAIHGFQKHAGSKSSEEYRKLIEEYRQKAIHVFIKIDKLKEGTDQ